MSDTAAAPAAEEGQPQQQQQAVRLHMQIDLAESAPADVASPAPPAYESPLAAAGTAGTAASPHPSPSESVASEDPDHLGVPGRKKGLGLPKPSSMEDLTSLRIVFENLSWTVRVKNPSPIKAEVKAAPIIEKRVLNEVSGIFRPGKFTAVMGSSGAGKTTLLNVCAGYGSGGVTTGRILVNGVEIGSEHMRELSSFVHQHDVIMPSMTVREAVTMAAFLRLPASITADVKRARVEEVLRWLSLTKVADNQIGSPLKKGISGGERRRVSVAMEMVRNPSILFLDEPTSGLDSFTAYSVAHLLRGVAHKHHRTIVATIHQPSSEIFHLFDDLVLLDQGRVIYAGPAAEAMQYFSANLDFEVPMYVNPADYIFMHILNTDSKHNNIGAKQIEAPKQQNGASNGIANGAHAEESKTPEHNGTGSRPASPNGSAHKKPTHRLRSAPSSADSARDREQRLAETWNLPNKLGQYTPQRTRLNETLSSHVAGTAPPPARGSAEGASLWTQFEFLCRRARNDVIRNPFKLRARIGQALFVAIFAGLVYLNLGFDQTSVQNRRGVLFFLCAGGVMNATMGTVAIFAGEKAVFQREFGARMYGLPAFYSSKILMELPLRIAFPFLQALIVYWIVGLSSTAHQFFILAGTLIMLDFTGTSIGMLLATIFPTLEVALAASPMFMLPLMLFSGFFLNADSIPDYYDWLSYLSPIKYGFVALAKNEFTGLTFSCESGQRCAWRTGEQVLTALNFDRQRDIASQEGFLLCISFGCLILSYLALWRSVRKL